MTFNFSIFQLSDEYSGLISFAVDLFDLLEVQVTLKSLLQHHNLKAPILQCSAFFMVQLSHPSMITGEKIALTRRIFVGKVMSLLFNTLSQFSSVQFSSVQFSRLVMSDSLRLHGLQHIRPPCPSPAPGVYIKSCPLSR